MSSGENNAGSQFGMLVVLPSEFPLEILRIKCLDWFSIQKLKLPKKLGAAWGDRMKPAGTCIVTLCPSDYTVLPAFSLSCQNKNQLIFPMLPSHQNFFFQLLSGPVLVIFSTKFLSFSSVAEFLVRFCNIVILYNCSLFSSEWANQTRHLSLIHSCHRQVLSTHWT